MEEISLNDMTIIKHSKMVIELFVHLKYLIAISKFRTTITKCQQKKMNRNCDVVYGCI